MSIWSMFSSLVAKLPGTLLFVLIAWILGLILGILVTAGRLSHIKLLKGLLNIYVSFIRSIPMILQLFIVYYGLPMLFKALGVDINSINRMVFCVVTFALYYGAYLSEILRPAYQAVNQSQRETASALGYNRWQTETKIIIPQAVPIALPALGNEIINMVHQTSLVFTIGVIDIMGESDQIIDQNYTVSPVLVYFLAGIVYLMITVIIDLVWRSIENRSGKFLETDGEIN